MGKNFYFYVTFLERRREKFSGRFINIICPRDKLEFTKLFLTYLRSARGIRRINETKICNLLPLPSIIPKKKKMYLCSLYKAYFQVSKLRIPTISLSTLSKARHKASQFNSAIPFTSLIITYTSITHITLHNSHKLHAYTVTFEYTAHNSLFIPPMIKARLLSKLLNIETQREREAPSTTLAQLIARIKASSHTTETPERRGAFAKLVHHVRRTRYRCFRIYPVVNWPRDGNYTGLSGYRFNSITCFLFKCRFRSHGAAAASVSFSRLLSPLFSHLVHPVAGVQVEAVGVLCLTSATSSSSPRWRTRDPHEESRSLTRRKGRNFRKR